MDKPFTASDVLESWREFDKALLELLALEVAATAEVRRALLHPAIECCRLVMLRHGINLEPE